MHKLFSLLALVFVLLAFSSAPVGTPRLIAENSAVYAATMEIVEIDREADLVLCRTATGFIYAFSGAEDYEQGEIISLLMDGRGTPKITDDRIITARSSGYYAGG